MSSRGPAVLVCLAALLGCSQYPGDPPQLTISATYGDTAGLEIEDYVLVPKQSDEETSTTIELTIVGDAENGVNFLDMKRYDEEVGYDVPVDLQIISRRARKHEATATLTLTVQRELLTVRIIDRGLYEDTRLTTVYYDPDIIEQVYMDGKHIDRVHNHRVGHGSKLMVVQHSEVVGDYELFVRRDLWDGSAWEGGVVEAYDPDDTFPAARGQYRYAVQALDAVSGYGETVEFVVYLQDVIASSPDPGEHVHVNDGSLEITWVWGDLDAIVGPDNWIVEIASGNVVRPYTTAQGVSIPLDDTGDFRARVGIVEGDGYAFTSHFVSGIVGTNDPPSTPIGSAGATIAAAPGSPVSFTVSATDPEGDDMHYEIQKGSYATLAIFYDPDTRTYTWAPDGMFDGDTGMFSWTLPNDDDFELTFTAVDRFGKSSDQLAIFFDIL